jgi:hypothetical protein
LHWTAFRDIADGKPHHDARSLRVQSSLVATAAENILVRELGIGGFEAILGESVSCVDRSQIIGAIVADAHFVLI